MTKKHWLEYKDTIEEHKDLLYKAFKAVKRRSTVQWIKNQFRIGILSKQDYIAKLRRIAGIVVDTES